VTPTMLWMVSKERLLWARSELILAQYHCSLLQCRICSVVVEFAKESRPRRTEHVYDRYILFTDQYSAVNLTTDDRPARTRRPPGFRVTVSGVSRDTSWQVRPSITDFRVPTSSWEWIFPLFAVKTSPLRRSVSHGITDPRCCVS
jgi:hypothetical protein